jgi:hypothetical protein
MNYMFLCWEDHKSELVVESPGTEWSLDYDYNCSWKDTVFLFQFDSLICINFVCYMIGSTTIQVPN